MDAAVQTTGKKTVKVLGAVCLAAGVVTLSAVVASGAAVGVVVEGFKSAKNTMQKVLKNGENKATDGSTEIKNIQKGEWNHGEIKTGKGE